MDTAKTNLTEYMHTHKDVAGFFPDLMIRRMSWIDKLFQKSGMEYSFDVIFDETEDEMPTVGFTIRSPEDEKNEITMLLTNFRTIEFYGQTRYFDAYSGEEIVHKMISAVSGEGMGLIFWAPSVEGYDDDLMGITPVFTLPVAAHEVALTVLESLIPALLSEHQKFLDEDDEVDEVEDMIYSDDAEESKDLEDPIFSAFANIDDITLLLEGVRKDIRDADKKIRELDQMIQIKGLPFA